MNNTHCRLGVNINIEVFGTGAPRNSTADAAELKQMVDWVAANIDRADIDIGFIRAADIETLGRVYFRTFWFTHSKDLMAFKLKFGKFCSNQLGSIVYSNPVGEEYQDNINKNILNNAYGMLSGKNPVDNSWLDQNVT